MRVESILIYVPNWIGDAVMATPFIRCAKNTFPEAQLTVLAKGNICELLKGLTYIDSFVTVSNTISGQISTIIGLRKQRFDLSFILPHSFRSALITFLIGARNRTGYRCNSRQFLLNHKVDFLRDEKGNKKVTYMTDEYFRLGRLWKIEDDRKGPELAVAKEKEAEWLDERASYNCVSPWIGIAPGAAFGPSKRWLIENFAEVARWIIQDYSTRPILLTGPNEVDIKNEFAKLCNSFIDPFHTYSSIEKLKSVVKNLDLLICNDSGTRHIAIAFGVPTLTILGPTAIEYSLGPYEKGIILRAKVNCAPCQLPECPIDHRCMKAITPEIVIEKIKTLLTLKRNSQMQTVEIYDIINN